MVKKKKKRVNNNDLSRRDKNRESDFVFVKEPDYLFVRSNAQYVRVNFEELICIRGKRGYVQVVTETQSYIIMNNLSEFVDLLPEHLFCRIHHSFIVAVNRIKAFDNDFVYLYGEPEGKTFKPGLACSKELPVGAFYRKNLKRSIWFLPSKIGRRSNEVKDAEQVVEYELEE